MGATHAVSELPDTRSSIREHVQAGDASRANWYVKLFRLVVRALLGFFLRVRMEGRDNIPRSQAIICCNHLGWADPFLILCYFRVEPRIYALGYSTDYISEAGAKAFRAGVLDSLKVMVPLYVDRPVESMRVTRDLLQRGGSLVIFPEGTFMGAEEGKLLPLQPGAAHLSQLTGLPLVPVGITGTKELWFRRTVTLRVTEPIAPTELEGGTRERVEAMTERLEQKLRSVLPGDREHARVKLLRNWLTLLFYGEEHLTDESRRRAT